VSATKERFYFFKKCGFFVRGLTCIENVCHFAWLGVDCRTSCSVRVNDWELCSLFLQECLERVVQSAQPQPQTNRLMGWLWRRPSRLDQQSKCDMSSAALRACLWFASHYARGSTLPAGAFNVFFSEPESALFYLFLQLFYFKTPSTAKLRRLPAKRASKATRTTARRSENRTRWCHPARARWPT